MPIPEFDKYKNTYQEEVDKSTAFIGKGQEFFTQVKARHIVAITERHFTSPSSIDVLDIGCGVGLTDHFLTHHFDNFYGIDISTGGLEQAKKRNPTVKYQEGSALDIPFPNETFDFIFIICVMHHIPPKHWNDAMNEMRRVLRPNGCLVVFEHNPYNPLTRQAVSNCVFDKDAVLLSMKKLQNLLQKAHFSILEQEYILFFPFKNALFSRIERFLTWCPLGAQHFVLGQKTCV